MQKHKYVELQVEQQYQQHLQMSQQMKKWKRLSAWNVDDYHQALV